MNFLASKMKQNIDILILIHWDSWKPKFFGRKNIGAIFKYFGGIKFGEQICPKYFSSKHFGNKCNSFENLLWKA